jgi:hypothetical protein
MEFSGADSGVGIQPIKTRQIRIKSFFIKASISKEDERLMAGQKLNKQGHDRPITPLHTQRRILEN